MAFALLAACAGEPKPSPSPEGLAGQVTDAAADTRLLREVQPVVNEAVRAGTDCEAARPALAAANARLEEAAKQVRTEAGRTSLASMRAQLKPIADLCP